ncbi:hypothetical protein WJX72_001751 [[Myrmecia] bisecta]|uniref:Integral membrane bound transporter domain-containing protein n=1 Tax=[Myrmecia] bisecta TaxID=41462 RepID=A0AAW1Q766_9CHLO
MASKLKGAITYPMLQSAAQLAVGTFIISLWVFVNKLTFPRICTLATWFIIDIVMVSTSTHMGSRLLGALVPIGAACISIVYAGAVLNLAHAAGPHHVTLLQCILGSVAFLPLVCVRATRSPLVAGVGTLFLLYGGVAYLSGQLSWPYRLLWKNVVWHLIYENFIASIATGFVGVFVLPCLAYTDMRRTLAGALGGLSASAAEYSKHIWREDGKPGSTMDGKLEGLEKPEQQNHGGGDALSELSRQAAGTKMLEELTDEQYLTRIRLLTDSQPSKDGAASASAALQPAPSALSLRPLLAKARGLSSLAAFEPPFVLPGPFSAAAWAAATDSVDALLTRVAAFESLLTEEQPLLASSDLLRYFQHDFSQAFRDLHARIAATLAEWQQAVAHGRPVPPQDWAHVKGYWSRYAGAEEQVEQMLGSANQVRIVLFMMTITRSMLDSLQATQTALNAALTPTPDNTGVKATVRWFLGLVPVTLGLLWFKRFFEVLFNDLPAWLSSWASFKAGLQDRMFQYGVKLYALIVVTLVAILVMNERITSLRTWNIYNTYLAAVLVMLPKVDATVTSGVFRALGTFIGACFGYLVMSNAELASNPYWLMLLLVAVAFVLGFWSLGGLKLGILFALLSFNALILCQYLDGPPKAGTKHYWAARIVPIVLGSVYPILWNACILPVYVSTEAMSELAHAFQQAIALLRLYGRAQFIAAEQAAGLPTTPKDRKQPNIKGVLEKTVAAPIAAVQASLATETVIWPRFVLVQPPVVHKTLAAMQVLLNHLAAVRIAAEQYTKHVELIQRVGSRVGSAYFLGFSEPLADEVRQLEQNLTQMADDIQRLVNNVERPAVADLHKQIEEFEVGRMHLRSHFLQLRAQFHKDVAKGKYLVHTMSGKLASRFQKPAEPPAEQLQIVVEGQAVHGQASLPATTTTEGDSTARQHSAAGMADSASGPESTPQQAGAFERQLGQTSSQGLSSGDAIRFMSWVHALLGCLDQMTRVAKLILAHEQQLQQNRWFALPWQPER